jgi:signal transduction histidine kinase
VIFVERQGTLEILSHWLPRQVPKTHLIEAMLKRGPVARVFATGRPGFWHQERLQHSSFSRYLQRLLQECRCPCVTCVPIGASPQRPIGVLALAVPHRGKNDLSVHDDVIRVAQIASLFMFHARAYEEAIAARCKAENLIQSKDEFLSMLSHELKNPMIPIMGWAVALSSGTLPADKQTLALEGIVRNIRSLNYMIEDMFDAARISAGKLRLQAVEIRIQDVAREALTAIQRTIESKKLRISTDISEAIPPFIADPVRLHQVLVNLLNNAIKFTPAGGAIALQVRRSGNSVECVISDTGRGIERKFLPFVFDMFRQENRSSKGEATGLGLGLAIVRDIVTLHGGSIEASSDGPGKGSSFVVRLPMRRRHGPSGPFALLGSRPAPGRKITNHPD